MISVNQNYTFNSNCLVGSAGDEITEDHYDNGRLSDYVWDNYDWWSDLNGSVVTVISVMSSKKPGACVEIAKVFLKAENFNWWFSVNAKELSSVRGGLQNPVSGACTCDLAAIMIRGCRCGGS